MSVADDSPRDGGVPIEDVRKLRLSTSVQLLFDAARALAREQRFRGLVGTGLMLAALWYNRGAKRRGDGLYAPGELAELIQRHGGASFDAALAAFLEQNRLAPGEGQPSPDRISSSLVAVLSEAAKLPQYDGVLGTRHLVVALLSYERDGSREPINAWQILERAGVDRIAVVHEFARSLAARGHVAEQAAWQQIAARLAPADDGSSALEGARNAPPDTAPASLVLDIRSHAVEPPVGVALRVANTLAGAGPIESHHVVVAAVAIAPRTTSAAFAQLRAILALEQGSPPAEGAEPSADRLAPSLRRQLAWVQQRDAHTNAPRLLWGRDLVTAALLAGGSGLNDLLARAHLDLGALLDDWYAFLVLDTQPGMRPRSAWRQWWQAAGVALPAPPRPSYATETDQGDDMLGIESEARAFARLILDRGVQAPLSIGLLGDWGSGKSFFIEQIKKQIQKLADTQSPELFHRIVKVEFNAWHASDANLWASLVTYIFDQIWQELSPRGRGNDDNEKKAQKSKKQLVDQIQEARGAVHEAETEVERARTALESAESELKRRNESLALKGMVTDASVKALRDVAREAGFSEALDTIHDVDTAVRSLTQSSQRARLTIAALLESPLRNLCLPALGVATLVAVSLALLGDSKTFAAEVGRWAAGLAGAIGIVVAPLRFVNLAITKFTERLRAVRDAYDAKLAKTDQPKARRLAQDRRELESAEASVQAAKVRLADLLNQQARLDPLRRLGAFLEERVQSSVYRSQQGIIALVHKDFRKLSDHMRELRVKRSAGANTADEFEPFDRIVVYVDDLDRCRPEHVVHMLEAVHLLLALDLFVVVVAVDSRWLTRSLEIHYKDLLATSAQRGGDGLRAATPQSYLEKIFQITYALRPMDRDGFNRYVKSLTASPIPVLQLTEERADPSRDAARLEGPTAPTRAQAGREPTQKDGASAAQDGTSNGARTAVVPGAVRLSQAMKIGKAEQEFICELAPLLPTPRIAKRLVNVYRLIKGADIESADAFDAPRRFRPCLLLLAVLFGYPGAGPEVVRSLHEGRPPFDDDREELRKAVLRRTGQSDEWTALVRALEALEVSATVGECAGEAMGVARYSLASGQDWHTWRRRTNKAAEKSGALPAATRSSS